MLLGALGQLVEEVELPRPERDARPLTETLSPLGGLEDPRVMETPDLAVLCLCAGRKDEAAV